MGNRKQKNILLNFWFKRGERAFIHLKMTSERSKRRDFLSLIFISKSIKKGCQ